MIAASLLGAASMFNACSEEEEKAKSAPDGALIATVAGKSWSSKIAGAVVIDGDMTISAESADGSHIVLVLNGAEVGTYVVSGIVDNESPENFVSYTPPGADVMTNPTYVSSNMFEKTNVGEVRITEVDLVNKTVSGTFICKVKRTVPQDAEIEIKSGSFTKVVYQEEPGSLPGNEFSAKIAGSTFAPSTMGGVKSFGYIVVSASGTASVGIGIDASTGTGTFDLGPMGSDYYATVVKNGTSYESVSGTLKITLHDKVNGRIEGTFSFTAEIFLTGGSPISVTEGSFAVSY